MQTGNRPNLAQGALQRVVRVGVYLLDGHHCAAVRGAAQHDAGYAAAHKLARAKVLGQDEGVLQSGVRRLSSIQILSQLKFVKFLVVIADADGLAHCEIRQPGWVESHLNT